VDQLTISASSSAWVTTIGATKTIHADFGLVCTMGISAFHT
jgi:hypothetical protein